MVNLRTIRISLDQARLLLVCCLSLILLVGCRNGSMPSDPFAANRSTIPPPGSLPGATNSFAGTVPQPNMPGNYQPNQYAPNFNPNGAGYPVGNYDPRMNPAGYGGQPNSSSIFGAGPAPNMQAYQPNYGNNSIFGQPAPATNNSWFDMNNWFGGSSNTNSNPQFAGQGSPYAAPNAGYPTQRGYESPSAPFDAGLPPVSRNQNVAWGGTNSSNGPGFWDWLTGSPNQLQPAPGTNPNALAMDPRSPYYQGQRNQLNNSQPPQQYPANPNPQYQPPPNYLYAGNPNPNQPAATNWNITPPANTTVSNPLRTIPNYTSFGNNTPGTPASTPLTVPMNWPSPGGTAATMNNGGVPNPNNTATRVRDYEDLPPATR